MSKERPKSMYNPKHTYKARRKNPINQFFGQVTKRKDDIKAHQKDRAEIKKARRKGYRSPR